MNPFDLNLARAFSAPSSFCPRPDIAAGLDRSFAGKLLTLVDGERRVGKSAGIIASSIMAGRPILHIDLMSVTSEEGVNDAFRWGWNCFRQHESQRFFSGAKAEISAKVPLTPITVKLSGAGKATPESWGDVIQAFDQRCALHGGILFIDEFQALRDLPKSGASTTQRLWARLQTSRHLTPVLASSSQALLSPMFATASAPFYKSVRLQLHVGPLDKAAFTEWAGGVFRGQARELETEAVNRLYNVTEGVTEDMIATCAELWNQCVNDRPVAPADIEVSWRNVVANAVSLFLPWISSLPPAQARLLRYISRNPNTQPFSATTLKDIGFNRSTVHGSLARLVEKSLVRERETDGRKRVWVQDARIAFYLRG